MQFSGITKSKFVLGRLCSLKNNPCGLCYIHIINRFNIEVGVVFESFTSQRVTIDLIIY